MKLPLYLFPLICIFPISAYAEDVASIQGICAYVSSLKKPAVGAEYVAGVDVYGSAVRPADVSTQHSVSVDPIVIPIELVLIERFGLDVPVGIELTPVVGEVHFYKDGRVTYNKADITKQLNVFCDKQAEKESDDRGKPDGHTVPNPVPSSDKIEGEYPVNQSK